MIIRSSDIFELDSLPNLQSVDSRRVPQSSTEFISKHHPKVGLISFKNALFPHLHLMDLRWKTEDAIELRENSPSDNININFHMAGNLDTRFSGIREELNMRPKKHNLVFSPEGGYNNKVGSNSSVEMFHISIEKNFFLNAIGCNDAWSEMVHQNILSNRPFSGVIGTLDTTPNMLRLIGEIRENRQIGPMRNLMLQSKVLELLALQIEQFRSPIARSEYIRPEDQEKLNCLKAFLDSHFLEDLTMAQLSRVCLLNEFKVKKGFKLLFEETVFGYIRKLRMGYAKNLLLDCSMSVEEVSEILGYEHAQHFSIAFKKFTGINPSRIFKEYSKLVTETGL